MSWIPIPLAGKFGYFWSRAGHVFRVFNTFMASCDDDIVVHAR